MYHVDKIIKSKKIKQAKIFIILLGILVSTFSNVLIFNNTHAVTEASSMTLNDRTQLYLEASALKGCFKYTAPNTYANPTVKISEENAKSGSWFGEKLTMYAGAKSGDVSCNSLVSSFKSKLEYPDYVGNGGFLCEFKSNRENGSKCESGNGGFISPFGSTTSAGDKLDTLISNKLFGGKGVVLGDPEWDPLWKDAGWYIVYFDAFFASCKPVEDSTLTVENETTYINVNILENGKKVSKNYAGSPKSEIKSIRTDLGTGTEVKMTCADIASNMNEYIDNYIAYMQEHKKEIGVKPEDALSTPADSAADSKTTCAVDGVGWIVCPVMTFLANITDQAFSMLANNFLKTDTELIGTGSDSATYNAWKIMRDIANVAFVIAFLVIIFSQLSSIGLDNYGIKKLLPKIIIAAILVNVSYIICQIAVDISNILGFSLKSLFDGLGSYMQTPETADDKSVSILGSTALIGGILIGGVSLALAISVPVLISAFFALIVIVIILLARTALIVLLIVISPLAFVAYLLPNTEEYFTKWRKTFTALLLVFPIISVVFGASGLAATVIKATAENDLTKVMALGVAVIPLFIVPGLLKKAIDSTGNIGAKISGMGDSLGKKASDSPFVQYQQKKINIDRALARGGSYSGRNPFLKASSKMYSGLNSSNALNSLTRGYGNRQSAAGIQTADEQREQDKKISAVQLKQARLTQAENRVLSMGGTVEKNGKKFNAQSDKSLRAAAIDETVNTNDVVGINNLWDASIGWNVDENDKLLRDTFTDSLMKSGARPAWLGAGAIAQRRDGTNRQTTTQAIESAVKNNVYSQEAISKADKDELAILSDTAQQAMIRGRVTPGEYDRLRDNTRNALADSILGPKMGKNRGDATLLANGRVRPPGDMPS